MKTREAPARFDWGMEAAGLHGLRTWLRLTISKDCESWNFKAQNLTGCLKTKC
jgi:hypothetical protein